jgi:hypothetical protein
MGLSDDGQLLAYTSDLDGQIYLVNTLSGGTTLVWVNLAEGAGDQLSKGPVMTPDSHSVFWSSTATNLVWDDWNQASDYDFSNQLARRSNYQWF